MPAVRFLVVILLLAVVLRLGSYLSARIQSEMGLCWRNSLANELIDRGPPNDPIYHLRTNSVAVSVCNALKKYVAPAFFALLFVYLGLSLISHALFNIQDVAGLVCKEKPVVYVRSKTPPHESKFW
jgi:hypothetical protein